MSEEDSNIDNLANQEPLENQSADSTEAELGQTRMEVAYGAGDGDDDAQAVVARKASMGVLYEQIYRPWNGELGLVGFAIMLFLDVTCMVYSEVKAIATTIHLFDFPS